MAGDFEHGGLKTFINNVETSARRLKINIDAIIEKYNKPFPQDDVINLSTLTIHKDKGSIRRIKGCHKFGTSPLISTKRKDELLRSQVGQKKSHIDPNVSMAITRQYNCYLKRSDDREGEPSDAETLDSDSSNDDDDDGEEGDAEEEEEEGDGNEIKDSESEVEDLEEEEVEGICSDNNVPESGRERVITGRKVLESEGRTGHVGKSGNAQVERKTVNRNGRGQVNDNDRERDNESGREQVNTARRVPLKSWRELATVSGSIQLKSGKELTSESGNIHLKSGKELVSEKAQLKSGRELVSEKAQLKSGRELVGEKAQLKSGRELVSEKAQLKSGRELVSEKAQLKSGRELVGEKAQLKSGRELVSEKAQLKSGRELVSEKAQLKSGREVVIKSESVKLKSGGEMTNGSWEDHADTGETAQRGGECVSTSGTKLDSGSRQGRKCIGASRSFVDSMNISCLDNSVSSVSGNLSFISIQSPKRVMMKTVIKNRADIPSEDKSADGFWDLHSEQNETFVVGKAGSSPRKPREHYSSTRLICLSTDGRKSGHRLQKQKSMPGCKNLLKDDSLNIDITFVKSGFVSLSSRCDDRKSENHAQLSSNSRNSDNSPQKKMCASAFMNLQTDHSVNMDVTYTKSALFDVSSRHESPVSESQVYLNPGIERCEKSVSGLHSPSHSGTERYEKAEKTRSVSASRNLTTKHPDSGNRSPTNGKSEHGLEKTYTSSFLNLQRDCSVNLDCSVIIDNSLNMDVTFEKSGLSGVGIRRESSGFDSQVSLSSSTERCENPVSKLHPPSRSGTGRCEDVPHITRSVTAGRNVQTDHRSSTSKMSTDVLRNTKACRKSLSDHSVEVHLMSEGLRYVGSPSKSKGPTTKRRPSNKGCRQPEVTPRKKSATSFPILGTDFSSSGSRKPSAGYRNWQVDFSPETDLVSEAMNDSIHAYNLRNKKSCSAQGELACQSPGDVSLTSSLRKLNIHPSRARVVLSPRVNLEPVRSNMAHPGNLLASPRSKLASPNSNSVFSNFSLASPLSKMTSPPSKSVSPCFRMTSKLSSLASPSSSLASSCSKLSSPCSNLASPFSDMVFPRSKLASPSSQLASPLSDMVSPRSQLASPLSDMVSPRSQLASPLSDMVSPSSQLASSLSDRVSPRSQLASPLTDMASTPSKFAFPPSKPTSADFTTLQSSVSKRHNSNKTLIHHATPATSNKCVENLVKCGLHVESHNNIQEATYTEPQCQSTNNQIRCSCIRQFLMSHGFDQEKWASASCEITTNQSSVFPTYGRLKRKAPGSFTSGYFTDASASPKRMQTDSAARSDNDLVRNITLTLPTVGAECLAESTCHLQCHGQQRTCLPELRCLYRNEQTTSQMENSGHTFCCPCDHISRDVISRLNEDMATVVRGRRFAVANKLRCLGSCNFSNPCSAIQQPVEDNWCCWSQHTSRQHCCHHPPSVTGSRVCECVKASSGQNNHYVPIHPIQVSPHVNSSRVCDRIEASQCTTDPKSNPVHCATCFQKMSQNQLTCCSSGQSAASTISSHVASLQPVREIGSTSHLPNHFQPARTDNHHFQPARTENHHFQPARTENHHFQPARTENQQRFDDRIRNSEAECHHQNHAPPCHCSADKACGRTYCSSNKVLPSSVEKQAYAVWKEIQAERFRADTQSEHLDERQGSCVSGSSSEISGSNSEAGERLDESTGASRVTNRSKQTSRLHVPNISAFLNTRVTMSAEELPSFVEHHSPSLKFKKPKAQSPKSKVYQQKSMFPESYLQQFSPMNPVRKDSDNSVLDYEQNKPSSLLGLETSGNSTERIHCHKKSGIVGTESRMQSGQINHSQSEVLHTSCQSISQKQQNIPHSPASFVNETFTLPHPRRSRESVFDVAGNSKHIYKPRGCKVTPTQIPLKSPGNRASTPIRTVNRFSEFCLDDTVSTICSADSIEGVGRLNDVKDAVSPELTHSDTLLADSEDSFEEVILL